MVQNVHPNAIVAESAVLGENIIIAPNCIIGENTVIGDGVILGPGCVLADNVRIGSKAELGCYVTVERLAVLEEETDIGHHSVVCTGTIIGKGTSIGSNSAIGKPPKASAMSTVKACEQLSPLKIGNNCIIGCSSVIYAAAYLDEGVFIGDRTLIRERCAVGAKTVVGSGCTVENDTKIGAYTKIQTGAYITAYMEIGERVFIAPMVTTTNDNFMGRTEKRFRYIKGAVIKRGARIGGGAILLPGVEIGEETFVAAGSLVTRDTPPRKVVMGIPAKIVKYVPPEELL